MVCTAEDPTGRGQDGRKHDEPSLPGRIDNFPGGSSSKRAAVEKESWQWDHKNPLARKHVQKKIRNAVYNAAKKKKNDGSKTKKGSHHQVADVEGKEEGLPVVDPIASSMTDESNNNILQDVLRSQKDHATNVLKLGRAKGQKDGASDLIASSWISSRVNTQNIYIRRSRKH